MNEDLSRRVAGARQQLTRSGGAGRGRGCGYGAKAREVAVGVARDLEATGMSRRRAAKALGIHEATLSAWMRVEGTSATFAQVEVASAPHVGGGLRLVLPSGAYVEGLDVVTLAAVVRSLS
jgi:DNA invertase Pin-like site-specific DNA recombinase